MAAAFSAINKKRRERERRIDSEVLRGREERDRGRGIEQKERKRKTEGWAS